MQTITVNRPVNGDRFSEGDNSYVMSDPTSVHHDTAIQLGGDDNENAANIAAALIKNEYDASATDNVVTVNGDVSFESQTDSLVVG